MKLEGSCHCRSVRFSVEAPEPWPFLRCYCSVCRKTGGGGGYAINLGARRATMEVEGEDFVRAYDAFPDPGEEAEGKGRSFCSRCGSMLWNWDPRWPELVHPFASAIDTPLPVAPATVHMMLGSKASWVQPAIAEHDQGFSEYPDRSLADWHAAHGYEE